MSRRPAPHPWRRAIRVPWRPSSSGGGAYPHRHRPRRSINPVLRLCHGIRGERADKSGHPGDLGEGAFRMTTVAYLRASAAHDISTQRSAVSVWLASEGLSLSAVFYDGRQRSTAGLAALLKAAEAGQIKCVVVAHPCCLAGSLPAVLRSLRRLRQAGVQIVAAADPDGLHALIAALDVLDELRARLHAEAVAAGRQRARRRGVQFGRPPLNEQRLLRVRAALRGGASIRRAAQIGGIGATTAFRIKCNLREADRQGCLVGDGQGGEFLVSIPAEG